MARQALTRKTPSTWPGVFVLTLILFGVLATNASAVTLVDRAGEVAQPYQHWADLSHVPTVSGVVTVAHDLATCGSEIGVRGCAFWNQNLIQIAAGPRCGLTGRRAMRVCRFATMHELGHFFDARMPEWKRLRFQRLIGDAGTWDAPDVLGTRTREYFADVYALCAMDDWYMEVPGRSTPSLSVRQFIRACHLIRIPNRP